MAIPDPHAIPENSDACTEYVTEADAAWDAGNSDHAYDLYDSTRNSSWATPDQYNHVNLRLGLIAQTRGHIDDAVVFFHASGDPAAKEALHALTNATTNDPTPDPDVIPASAEQAWAWVEAARLADDAHDYERAVGLYNGAGHSGFLTPGQNAQAFMHAGIALEQLGRTDDARHTYETAISHASDQADLAYIAGRIKALGGGESSPDDNSPAAAQVAAGVIAYQNGDASGARTAFEAALHLDGSDAEKGRAQYYLGAMDYQAHQYANARNHVEAAAHNAPDPERSWAVDMLHWRWDEADPNAPYAPTEI